MRKQLIIIGIVVILICLELSGCTNNSVDTERNKFVGTWNFLFNGITYRWIFFSNGAGSRAAIPMTWTIKYEKLVIKTNESTLTYNYSFSNNNKTLTLIYSTGQDTLVLNKQ